MKHLLILAALLASLSAQAETTLTVATVSYHGDRSGDWNEKNPGLGVEHNDWLAGYYRNSYDKDTFYAGYAWRPLQVGYVKAGVIVAAATGYPSPVVALPSVVIEGPKGGVEIIGAPAVGKGTTWFVGLNLRFKF